MRLTLSDSLVAILALLLTAACSSHVIGKVQADTRAEMPDTSKMSPLELLAWRASQTVRQDQAEKTEKELPPMPEGVTRLTDTPKDEMQPCWPPDGKTLYYVSRLSTMYSIYRLDLESGHCEAVTDSLWPARTPDISPDGRHLVFSSRMLEIGDKLWIRRLADGETAKLTPEIGQRREAFPRWNRKGMKIYYESSVPGSMDSRGMEVLRDGESQVEMVTGLGTHSRPAVSWNGKKVAWVNRTGRECNIQVVDTNVHALVQNYDLPGIFFSSTDWLPGDRKLVVSYVKTSEALKGYDLGILDLDTGELSPLLDLGKTELDPRVSPDGKRLAFRADREGQFELYIYELP